MGNSKRFIDAYNKLDKSIRYMYNIKSSVGFSAMVRQVSAHNALLRRYEDVLYDYSRLRNAIVHESSDDIVIAEPHISVVENIEHILQLVQKPPLVVDELKQGEVLTADADDSLFTLLARLAKRGFSHLPVYDEGRVIGVINPKNVAVALGNEILEGGSLTKEYLCGVPVRRILTARDAGDYIFGSAQMSVVEAVSCFQTNRRLKAILLTERGDASAPVLRIVTASDAVDFQTKIL